MKTIIVKCAACGVDVTKLLKEHKRRIKAGATRFFCNLHCAGTMTEQMPPLWWNGSPEHRTKMSAVGKANAKYSSDERPFQRLIRSINSRAARLTKCGRTMAYDLDISYLQELWLKQDGRCALSNIPMQLGCNTSINTQASIDRIDSSLGYVKGNVQFVVCAINYAKSTASNEEAFALIALILEHSKLAPPAGLEPA